MPSIRHTDRLAPARQCGMCRTTHRPGLACPPPSWWLVSGVAAVPVLHPVVSRQDA